MGSHHSKKKNMKSFQKKKNRGGGGQPVFIYLIQIKSNQWQKLNKELIKAVRGRGGAVIVL